MKLLLQYLKPYKWLIALALLLAAINQVFSMFDPLLFGKLIDRYSNHPHFFDHAKKLPRTEWQYIYGVLGFLGLMVGTAMVSRIAKSFQDYAVNVIIQKFGAALFTDGLKHSMRLPYQDFEDQRSGETLSILTKARADCEKFIGYFINVLFGILVGVIFVSVYAFHIHWSIMPTYVIGIAVLSWLTNKLSNKIKTIQKRIVRETTTLAGATTESLRNIELVKSLGLTDQEIKRLNNNTYKILGLELKKVKSIRTIGFIQGTFVNLLRQIIMLVLMWLIFKDILTTGQQITLQFYSFFIFGPLQEIGNILLSYREAEASINNFHHLMSKAPDHIPASPQQIGDIESLTFEQVSFQHQTANYKAIDGISFKVRQGETVAFVGPSGAGKSTLVKLLTGLYRPKEGNIYYNGINGNELNFDDLRNQIGIVTQDTQLFAGTIKENLLFVKPNATDDEIIEALQKASCNQLLAKADNGIDTLIGESGLKLSGGEKQRISIARALIRKPHLLLFDEATSALDSITEEEITNTIKQVSNEKAQITFLIAHRLSTIMHADRIYVLEKGQIVETGTHESLVALKGLYYAMWRQQIGERKLSTIHQL